MEIQKQIAEAVAARKGSLTQLRSRIINLIDGIPVGTNLSDQSGLVARIVRVETGASQWANSTWDVTISGWAVVDANGHLIAESLDSRYFDGNNMHHRSDEPTCLPSRDDDYHGSRALIWANGASTRAVATRLAPAIVGYLRECTFETEANSET